MRAVGLGSTLALSGTVRKQRKLRWVHPSTIMLTRYQLQGYIPRHGLRIPSHLKYKSGSICCSGMILLPLCHKPGSQVGKIMSNPQASRFIVILFKYGIYMENFESTKFPRFGDQHRKLIEDLIFSALGRLLPTAIGKNRQTQH